MCLKTSLPPSCHVPIALVLSQEQAAWTDPSIVSSYSIFWIIFPTSNCSELKRTAVNYYQPPIQQHRPLIRSIPAFQLRSISLASLQLACSRIVSLHSGSPSICSSLQHPRQTTRQNTPYPCSPSDRPKVCNCARPAIDSDSLIRRKTSRRNSQHRTGLDVPRRKPICLSAPCLVDHTSDCLGLNGA